MRTLAVVFLCCGFAAAQDSALREKLQKQMEEISRLMRDSEGKLLEMTRVDTVVETQARIVDELQKLLDQAPPATNAAAEEREKRRQELEEQQEEIARKLKELFEGQERSAGQTVKELQELLRNLPRQRHGQGGKPDDKKKGKRQKHDRQKKRLRNRDEKKQEEPRSPREKREQKRDPRTGKRVKDNTEAGARLRRIEAWIVRLPPEDQERINRNDFSTIPPRYQRLVREYTALRAQREAKEEGKKDR